MSFFDIIIIVFFLYSSFFSHLWLRLGYIVPAWKKNGERPAEKEGRRRKIK